MSTDAVKTVITNRKARHDFFIEDTVEAGLVLKGSEVKSLRAGRANMQEAFCSVRGGEMYLRNLHISPWRQTDTFVEHEPLRERKLLLHRREIDKWRKATEQQGYTIVPLKIYFKNSYAKVLLGLAKGKKTYDKRADIAERDNKRRLDRITRGGRL